MKPGFKSLAIVLGVISIVAVLTSFAWQPTYRLPRKPHSRNADCASNVEFIGRACDRFYASKGRYPKNLSELTPDYLSSVPGCPARSDEKYKILYSHRDDEIEVFCEEGSLLRKLWSGYWVYSSSPPDMGKLVLIRD